MESQHINCDLINQIFNALNQGQQIRDHKS
jgi:hypothetical protein